MTKKREYKDIKYNPYSFRLHKETVNQLKKIKGNLSWNKFFLNIINKEFNNSCHFCGTYQNLEKHHIVAKKDGGSDEENNLIYLCVECQKKTENWGNKQQKKQ